MLSLTFFDRRFTPKLSMTLIFLLFFTLLASLGFWQLRRAAEKVHMLNAAKIQSASKPNSWSPNKPLPQQYQLVRIEGTYLSMLYLLDNQFHQHQAGYDVLSPFLLNNGEVVLIDRGFVQRKDKLQDIRLMSALPKDAYITLTGQTYYPSAKQWLLGPTLDKQEGDVTVVEKFDPQLFTQLLHKSVYPFIIRLQKDEPYGFVREWQVVAMSPARHRAYAFQWFAMAFCVLVLYIGLNLKKKHED